MEINDFAEQNEAARAAAERPEATDSAAAQTQSGRMPTDDVAELEEEIEEGHGWNEKAVADEVVGDGLSGYDALTDDQASGEGDGDNDINITESDGPFLEGGNDVDTGAGGGHGGRG